MLRKLLICMFVAAAATCALAFGGCISLPDKGPDTSYYLIQYFDGTSTRTLEVQNGDIYSLEQIPQKEGCDFLGLFDTELGGIKYVDSYGMCTMPFSGNKNLILYPQFEKKSFTFVFDYGEANNAEYKIDVGYGDKITLPPEPSAVYGRKFNGWFTEKECGGKAISETTVMNYGNFGKDSFTDGKLTLYAGFSDIYYSVKQRVGDVVVFDKSVKCGTPLADILVTEMSDGRIIAEWSKYENGSAIWDKTVEEDLELYAVKIGYKIYFDSNGGSEVKTITGYGKYRTQLPSPTKEDYDFMGWRYNGENIGTSFIMPDSHVSLSAEWKKSHYTVSYDVNGGEAIDSVKVRVGSSVPMPEAVKQYNAFKGWLYEGKETENLRMPEKNIVLSALWERTHYCVTIVSSLDGGKLKEVYIPFGHEFAFEPIIKSGYEYQGLFDSTDKEYTEPKALDGDRTFTARYAAKRFEIAYSLQGGTIAGNVNGTTVTYNSAYGFPVPKRNFYKFIGWYTSGGTKLTDASGVGTSTWKIAENVTAYAKWEKPKLSGQFAEYTQKKITDSGVEKQYYDTVNLKTLFGMSMSEYRALGYTKMTIKIALDIKEIDDGYQAMGISNTHGTWSNTLWQNYDIEHGSGKTDKTRWTHYFECAVDLNKFNDVIYLIYSAHGSLDDDWYRCSVVLNMTIS